MYTRYLGRELYDKVDSVVNKAFHKYYTYSEDNWYSVDKIELDYCTCESEEDLPYTEVSVRFGTKCDNNFSITFHYFLEENDDFNMGYLCRELDNI
ncbi:MAG: hypothetical protein IJH65_03865 [Methanobrevibacter sp.]|nr:hypothetical protein [Methanobrevibacter sp.]